MTPQQLHDLWLIVNVVAVLEVAAVAIYLWWMFRGSARRRFFWVLAAILASIAIDQTTQEIKNLGALPPADTEIAWTWLLGRLLVVVVTGGGLGYMVFGRNGQPVTPVASSTLPTTPKE